MTLSSFVIFVTTTATLAIHIALVLFAIGLALKVPFVQSIRRFCGRNSLVLSFIVALSALVGSLLYSEALAFDPCVLCWIQRIFIYPQILLAGLAMYWKESNIEKYLVALSIPGAVVALYHSWTQLGGFSITPCTAVGGACTKLYVFEYGYITIPMMSFTIFALMLVFALCRKYENRSR